MKNEEARCNIHQTSLFQRRIYHFVTIISTVQHTPIIWQLNIETGIRYHQKIKLIVQFLDLHLMPEFKTCD